MNIRKSLVIALGVLSAFVVVERVNAGAPPKPAPPIAQPGPISKVNLPTLPELAKRVTELEAEQARLKSTIASLTSQLKSAQSSIDALGGGLRTHTHPYAMQGVGLLQEKINGRFLKLAIDPKVDRRETGPSTNAF